MSELYLVSFVMITTLTKVVNTSNNTISTLYSPGAKCLFLKICRTLYEEVIFAFKRSYITSEIIKSMLGTYQFLVSSEI